MSATIRKATKKTATKAATNGKAKAKAPAPSRPVFGHRDAITSTGEAKAALRTLFTPTKVRASRVESTYGLGPSVAESLVRVVLRMAEAEGIDAASATLDGWTMLVKRTAATIRAGRSPKTAPDGLVPSRASLPKDGDCPEQPLSDALSAIFDSTVAAKKAKAEATRRIMNAGTVAV